MTKLMHLFPVIDRLADYWQNLYLALPVVYSTSVIDTPAIYVGSGAAAASNVTGTLIISDTLNDNGLEE